MKHQTQFNIRYSEFNIQYLINHIRLLHNFLQKVVIVGKHSNETFPVSVGFAWGISPCGRNDSRALIFS